MTIVDAYDFFDIPPPPLKVGDVVLDIITGKQTIIKENFMNIEKINKILKEKYSEDTFTDPVKTEIDFQTKKELVEFWKEIYTTKYINQLFKDSTVKIILENFQKEFGVNQFNAMDIFLCIDMASTHPF